LDSTFKFELRDAFIVRVEPLKKIHGLLSDRIGKTTITAECVDDVTREFDSFSKLEAYENSNDKRIVNLRLRARADDWKKEATVEFTDKWYFGGTRLEVRASDDVVTRLRSDLLDVVSGLRPWYHFINRFDVFGAALLGLGILYIALLTWLAVYGSDESSNSTPRQTGIAYLAAVAFCTVYFGFAYFIHRFRRFVFPHGTFAIGQEIQRLDVAEKWRWGLLIAFLPSLAAGVVLLWFQI
jgi:hypothetical protein